MPWWFFHSWLGDNNTASVASYVPDLPHVRQHDKGRLPQCCHHLRCHDLAIRNKRRQCLCIDVLLPSAVPSCILCDPANPASMRSITSDNLDNCVAANITNTLESAVVQRVVDGAHAGKVVRLLSKTLYWFIVFSVQLAYAAANAPRLDADTCITQATAETLKVPGSAIKLRLPTSTSTLFTLSVNFRCLCS